MRIDMTFSGSAIKAAGVAFAAITLLVTCSPKAKPLAPGGDADRVATTSSPAAQSVAAEPAAPAVATSLPARSGGAAPAPESATVATNPRAATASPAASADAKDAGKRIPADHVKDKHGAMHKLGYKRPEGICTACHGADLRGSGRMPSCYSCHGKKWKA